MNSLLTLFPNADDLLALTPSDLAPHLLTLARNQRQSGGMFWPSAVTEVTTNTGMIATNEFGYPYHTKQKVEALIGETWELLRREGYIMPAPDTNGRNGWMVVTSDGESVGSTADFERLRELRSFPKSMLHPVIAQKVYSSLMRGELDEAVFAAFKAVEIAVRAAGGYQPADIGVPLMRKAFDCDRGPLSDMTHPASERESLCHLFAGAIGSYKNPHSHRTVALTDPAEAREQVLLATHLLRIVDTRRPAGQP